jgi:hypothetical protein
MAVGAWHEVPFPLVGETHFVCICTSETNDNLEAQDAMGEAHGGDLEKIRMDLRFGRSFVIEA